MFQSCHKVDEKKRGKTSWILKWLLGFFSYVLLCRVLVNIPPTLKGASILEDLPLPPIFDDACCVEMYSCVTEPSSVFGKEYLDNFVPWLSYILGYCLCCKQGKFVSLEISTTELLHFCFRSLSNFMCLKVPASQTP